jgi:ATP-dependent RNA helicase DDX10/DBP4
VLYSPALISAHLFSRGPFLSAQGFLAEDPELKFLARKALIAYVRSVHLQSNKGVFDVDKLPLLELAETMGLPGVPKLKMLKKSGNEDKNMPYGLRELSTGEKEKKKKKVVAVEEDKHMSKVAKLLKRKNTTVMSASRAGLIEEEAEDEEEVFAIKRKDHDWEVATTITTIITTVTITATITIFALPSLPPSSTLPSS